MRERVRRWAGVRPSRVLPPIPGDRWAAVGALAAVLALASAAHSLSKTWNHLDRDHDRYAAMSELERRHAFATQLGVPGDPFDFFAANVERGDRVFYQVKPSGLGHFLDLPQTVAAIGRYYLLPAVAEPDLDRANVVVSWEQDPALLGVELGEQQRAGLQLFFVSRIAR
jgi:hypothetical protein